MTALGTSSDLLTMAEVAARLHVSESQLRKIVKAGSIPFVNIGLGERGWETGERNGAPAAIPQPIAILVGLALDMPAVRARLGIADPAP